MSLYTNDNYKVEEIIPAYQELVSIEAQENDNYAVVNVNTGLVESTSQSLPQALLSAEQLNHLLASNYHKEFVKAAYGTAEEASVLSIVPKDIH